MIQQTLSYFFQKAKENLLPLTLVLIVLLLDLYLAAMGPYFYHPYWAAFVFPLLIIAPLTLSFFYLGGVLGALASYLLFSFLLLETILAFFTGNLTNNLLCALAASGIFHHFKSEIFIWGIFGLCFILFSRKFFQRNLKKSGGFFFISLCFFALNFPLSYFKGDAPLRVRFSPHFYVGLETGIEELTPLSAPFMYSHVSYALRHVLPGPIGDLLAIIGFANDPGADSLPKSTHPMPKNTIFSPQTSVQNIVLIMGESATATHHHAYGYPLETTPEIDRLLSEGKACKIEKAHSAANLTLNAVLPSISLWKPSEPNLVLNAMNLMELANKQGYQTYWASTQGERGAYSGYIGYVAKYADHFIDPDSTDFTFKGESFSLQTEEDELQIPLFEKFSSDASSQKKFILLHFLGSHVPYNENVRPLDEQALPKATNYDQSIHRTDRLLSQIQKVAEKNLDHPLIIYLSDHGEDPESAGGHALGFGGKDYDIPLILIGEKAQENCDYIETLRAQNGWYSSNMNKFLVMRLLGMTADKSWIEQEKNPDLVFHIDYKTHAWGKIPGQHLND